MREEKLFHDSWLFCLGDEEKMAGEEYDDSGWEKVMLPHDWSIRIPLSEKMPSGAGGGYAACGIGWYRKHFDLDPIDRQAVYSFYFEGVYMDCTIYLNGERTGAHGYGYGSFYVDVTGKLREKDNIVAVRVNNSAQPNSRWYTGSGIYRNVYLVKKGPVHFGNFGIRCATNGIFPEIKAANLQIRSMVENSTEKQKQAGVLHKLYDRSGELIFSAGTAVSLEAGEQTDTMCRPQVENPHLWTPRDPYLYTLESFCLLDGEIVDQVKTQIGIRTAAFDADEGFMLNGKPVKIKGVCLHHDCGITGAVGTRELWERRLRMLKDMGCNGIRMSHNPPAPVLLDLCDEMGFLVMDEIYDEWMLSKNKNENYYSESMAFGASQFFIRDSRKELTAMIRRDYNHPSIILWSIGNEIPEQSSVDGSRIASFLQEICHEEDTTRMVTCACDNIMAYPDIRTKREFEEVLDVVGYNYVGRWRERAETFYDEDRRLYPKRRFIGTENPGAGGIRGDYQTRGGMTGDYRTVMISHELLWRYEASRNFVAGDFVWTGIDYLGEAEWPRRGADFGAIDTAGFKKDTFYYYRSIWNQDDITLHLLPHWNFQGEEGHYKTVIAYTNCQYVTLYLNDRLIGTKGYYEYPRFGAVRSWTDGREKNPTTNDLHLAWDVLYEPGVLRAEGFVDGRLAAEAVVETTERPVRLIAKAYKDTIRIGEIAQIELYMEDKNGRRVPDAEPVIACEISGEGEYLGMDGGNMLDLNMFREKQRRMFAGALLCEARGMKKGKINLRFIADQEMEAEIEIRVTE
ncbi:MAG TPA: DUF4982 domain-containing protein [Candidatus Eisenbergiella merdavium]|uniref:DUF4982 domain-containing protein n=1 Tax=Candidatus Eisenbergiella merdavium TaxID=2838551 RepID=A0A9D2NHA6_9FIRM|nr:DUF4982 domain-containing protein [Candidatus Eisenbergiella merdavium]